jgi:acylphosphatase
MKVCKRVHFRGTVQGVGFRMTTHHIASHYAVGGYVRNLPDGQVEVVVAGEADEVEQFLAEIGTRMAGYITGHRIVDEPPQDFPAFEIRK